MVRRTAPILVSSAAMAPSLRWQRLHDLVPYAEPVFSSASLVPSESYLSLYREWPAAWPWRHRFRERSPL